MKGRTKTLLPYICFMIGVKYEINCQSTTPTSCEEGNFMCNNGDCIPSFWRCDDTDDCGDNSDEEHCGDNSRAKRSFLGLCFADEMKCANGRCVMMEYKCDSEDDCGDNTDEMNCTKIQQNRQCDELSNFRCNNGKCIPRSWTCNKVNDCGDNSDESVHTAPHCVPFAGCRDGFFQCNKTGLCIHDALVCDKNFNCGKDQNGIIDKSDETICTQRTCKVDEFKCDNGRCISNKWKCDKQNDCVDASDERNCSTKSCTQGEFKCESSGHCIPKDYKCDEFNDCIDGSDEKDCQHNNTQRSNSTRAPYTLITRKANTSVITKTHVQVFSCKKDQFSCKGENKCLLLSWLCDGESDCIHGDDESPAVCTKEKCEPHHYACANKKCIDERNICDGLDHCGDGSDERNCTLKGHIKCTHDTYKCKGSQKCILRSSICDRKKDCPFEDDEDPRCGVNECLQNNGNCSSICRDLPIGFRCECQKGYEMDPSGTKCVDTNECHVFGTCSQDCVNFKGSYACECNKGYSIDALNNHSCRADGPTPYLYFTNRYDIRKLSLNGKKLKLVTQTRHVSGLAVHYKENMLYWADQGLKTISRISMNGSGKPEVIVQNMEKPGGLAIDWIGKKIYWTDLKLNQIGVSNLDGTHKKVLYQGGDHEQIRTIQVYPEKGYLFWVNWGGHSKIERSNLDGSNKTTLVSIDLSSPTSIAIDNVKERIYWTEVNSIKSIQVDGSGYKKIIDGGVSRPYGLTVFEDNVYWTDFVEKSIYKANKFNGEDMVKLEGRYVDPLDIILVHPLVQSDVFHPCKGNNGGCSHLCFMTSSDKKRSCACPDGMVLSNDQKTCTAIVKPSVIALTTQTVKIPVTERVVSVTERVIPATEKVITVTKRVITEKSSTDAPITVFVPPTDMPATTQRTHEATIERAKKVNTTLSMSKQTTTLDKVTIVAESAKKSTHKPTTMGKKKTLIITKTDIYTKQKHSTQIADSDKSNVAVLDASSNEDNIEYIVTGVLCFVGVVMIVVFSVVCVRRRRPRFDSTMVYETLHEEVYEKTVEKNNVNNNNSSDVKNQKLEKHSTSSKGFDNVNFIRPDDSMMHTVHMNADDTMDDVNMDGNMTAYDGNMIHDVSSSSLGVDDRSPIIDKMF